MATIFEKIMTDDIPSVQLYSDKTCIVILDINPVSKGHALVISRNPYPTIGECPEDVFSHLCAVARKVDERLRQSLGCDATNIMINNGPAAGQDVPHLHIHVIPRYASDKCIVALQHEKYDDGEMAEYGKKLKMTE
ncbi:HIT family protein [Parasphaerochaeta coccoides]|uniref:Histidine triad (HIT) protein n=1 Tax=Parasphaerochaeta coccoides (strain ATCC BAA-1237 / DSM 17374 / SPN1) TaxID=760011 RepID=F4GM18_PARC1|nr:HIT family protein [Parasphaerochaeta coccoides]AEC02493.1 histidine triad (HIT) protein [Parasphaerochaeta coccoides DSM 17374]